MCEVVIKEKIYSIGRIYKLISINGLCYVGATVNSLSQRLTEHKYNSKKFTFHNIEVVRKYIDAKILQGINLEKIKWKKVVNVVKTKNVFDCRNKLVQILQVLFRNNQSLDELLSHFLSKQKPTD